MGHKNGHLNPMTTSTLTITKSAITQEQMVRIIIILECNEISSVWLTLKCRQTGTLLNLSLPFLLHQCDTQDSNNHRRHLSQYFTFA